METGKVHPVIDSMHFRGGFRKTVPQKFRREIAHRHDGSRVGQQFRERNHEVPGREDVVGVRGEAVGDAEELLDPIRGPCRHSRKVRMQTPDAGFLQTQPDIDGLIKA